PRSRSAGLGRAPAGGPRWPPRLPPPSPPRRGLALLGDLLEQPRPYLGQPAVQFSLDLLQGRPRMLRSLGAQSAQHCLAPTRPLLSEDVRFALPCPPLSLSPSPEDSILLLFAPSHYSANL